VASTRKAVRGALLIVFALSSVSCGGRVEEPQVARPEASVPSPESTPSAARERPGKPERATAAPTPTNAPTQAPPEAVAVASPDPQPTPSSHSGVPQGWDYPPAFEANSFVLENRDHGPELCFGGVATSLPPQCGGVPAVGWDWDDVEGEESRSGSTWGYFRVEGSYDGETFSIHDAGDPQRRLENGPQYGPTRSACPERRPTDRDRWDSEHLEAATRYANRARDVSAVWIDYLKDPKRNQEPEDPDEVVLNVAFTGRLEQHEVKLREIWGGPLCVVRYELSRRYLQRIQNELHGEMRRRLDLEVTASGIDEVGNSVQLEVVWIDRQRRDYLSERYGRGVVEVYAALEPLR
jgi:hypothetical protein